VGEIPHLFSYFDGIGRDDLEDSRFDARLFLHYTYPCGKVEAREKEGIAMNKLFIASATLGVLVATGAAHAETYAVKQANSQYIACYKKEYVPATYVVNTRGKLVQKKSVGWVISGDRWDRMRYPAVYIETRRMVESDHYKLVSTSCR
jgi:hypothetical protein